MEWTQNAFINGFLQGDGIGDVVITKRKDIFLVQTFRGSCQSEQEFWFEVIQNPLVGGADRMMEFYDHHEVHTISGTKTQKNPLGIVLKGFNIVM